VEHCAPQRLGCRVPRVLMPPLGPHRTRHSNWAPHPLQITAHWVPLRPPCLHLHQDAPSVSVDGAVPQALVARHLDRSCPPRFPLPLPLRRCLRPIEDQSATCPQIGLPLASWLLMRSYKPECAVMSRERLTAEVTRSPRHKCCPLPSGRRSSEAGGVLQLPQQLFSRRTMVRWARHTQGTQ